MKRTIEIEDSLQERVDSAIEEVKQELFEYLEENTPDSTPDLGNDLDYSGSIREIVDGSVPIYTKEIEDTWYLHRSELEQAYEDAGVGSNSYENDGRAAIYFYIDQEVREWYCNNADDIFEEWKELRERAQNEGTEAGEEAAARYNEAPADYEETPNPYGADSESALHEIWQDAYNDAFEAGKEY